MTLKLEVNSRGGHGVTSALWWSLRVNDGGGDLTPVCFRTGLAARVFTIIDSCEQDTLSSIRSSCLISLGMSNF